LKRDRFDPRRPLCRQPSTPPGRDVEGTGLIIAILASQPSRERHGGRHTGAAQQLRLPWSRPSPEAVERLTLVSPRLSGALSGRLSWVSHWRVL